MIAIALAVSLSIVIPSGLSALVAILHASEKEIVPFSNIVCPIVGSFWYI